MIRMEDRYVLAVRKEKDEQNAKHEGNASRHKVVVKQTNRHRFLEFSVSSCT